MSTDEDTELEGTLAGTDSDGDTLTFALADEPEHGAVTIDEASGAFSYTPAADYNGADSFTFTVSDGSLTSPAASVSITVNAVNDAAAAAADAITVAEGETAMLLAGGGASLLANDSDAEGDALTVDTTPVTSAAHGTLILNADGSFSYAHDGSESATDSFVYRACDASFACGEATVSITVTGVNDAPVAAADAITVAEGGTATALTGGGTSLLANDDDVDGDTLLVNATPVTNVAHGTLTLGADGTFSYVHDGGQSTSDSFVYRACDSLPACSDATVTITITPVNDAPVAVGESITVAEGGTATTPSLLANDTDADGDTLSVVTTPVTNATHGTLTLSANGAFSYVHDGGQSTSDSFVYRACDGSSACSDATATITITPVNDPPVAVADSITVAEGGTATTPSLLANDTDADGDTLTIVTTPVTNAANGMLTLNANGTFSYVHNGGETTSDSFVYRACDGSSACSNATATIAITPVNDAPVLAGGPFTVQLPSSNGAAVGTVTVTDPEASQTHGFSITAGNGAGVFAIGSSSGAITVANAAAAVAATYQLTIQATDNGAPAQSGTRIVSIEVLPVGTPPMASADSTQVNGGATAITLDLVTNDMLGMPSASVASFGGGTLGGAATSRAAGTTFAANGLSVSVSAAGVATISTTAFGTFTFEYRLSNAAGFSDALVTVTSCVGFDVGGTFLSRPEQLASFCVNNPTGSAAQYLLQPMNLTQGANYALNVVAANVSSSSGGIGSTSAGTDSHITGRAAHHDEIDTRRTGTGSGTPVAPASQVPSGVPTVGDPWSLNVDITTACTSGTAQAATVRAVGTHSIVVTDNSNPAGGFSTAELEAIAYNFDNLVYPAVTTLLGTPSDRDNNQRVVIFVTAALNRLSPPASSAVTLARALTRDLLAQQQCPTSNAGEIIYALAPDPTGEVNSNVRTVGFTFPGQMMAHELAHLIVDSHRLSNGGAFEESWLDEALAGAAMERTGFRAPRGIASTSSGSVSYPTVVDAAMLTAGQNIVVTNLTTGPNASRRVAAFNTYINGNFGELRPFLQSPWRWGFTDSSQPTLAMRGAATQFLRYAADRYALETGMSEAQFHADLANNTISGLTNLEDVSGEDAEEWMRDYLTAIFVDDSGIANIDDPALPYRITTWSYRSLYTALNGSYQLAIGSLGNNTPLTSNMGPGGTTAFAGFTVEPATTATITFTPPAGSYEFWYRVIRRQ